MTTPEELERKFTLLTAAARYDELRTRDALAPGGGTVEDGETVTEESLSRAEALELIALGEVLARKAGYGRQLSVRTARAAGASWSQIGSALGTSKQSAWEAHARWIEEQADEHRQRDLAEIDGGWAAEARAVARLGEDDRTPTSTG